jgi:hypothetical protein
MQSKMQFLAEVTGVLNTDFQSHLAVSAIARESMCDPVSRFCLAERSFRPAVPWPAQRRPRWVSPFHQVPQ